MAAGSRAPVFRVPQPGGCVLPFRAAWRVTARHQSGHAAAAGSVLLTRRTPARLSVPTTTTTTTTTPATPATPATPYHSHHHRPACTMFGAGPPRFGRSFPGSRSSSSGGSPIFASPVLLSTAVCACIGWLVAFIGQCALQAKLDSDAKHAGRDVGQAHLPYLWFGIFAQLGATLLVLITLQTRSVASYRQLISALLVLAIAFSVMGADQTIYTVSTDDYSSAAHAAAAGYILCLAADIPWLLILGSEPSTWLGHFAGEPHAAVPVTPGVGVAAGSMYTSPAPGDFGSNAAFHQPMPMETSNTAGYGSLGAGYGPTGGGYAPHAASATDLAPQAETIPMSHVNVAGYAREEEKVAPAVVPSPPAAAAALSQDAPVPDDGQRLRARALYAYTASPDDPTEISFAKGEVLDITDNSGKWWQARKADGRAGIVPSNYMQRIE